MTESPSQNNISMCSVPKKKSLKRAFLRWRWHVGRHDGEEKVIQPRRFRSPRLQESTLVEALTYRHGIDPTVTDSPFFDPLETLQLHSETRRELRYLFVLPRRSLHSTFTKSWRWRGNLLSLSFKISLKIGVLMAQHLQLNER